MLRSIGAGALLFGVTATPALAAGSDEVAQTFLWIALVLVCAKLGALVSRIGQPAVLGELLIGIVLGNFVLVGIGVFEPIESDKMIAFLAQLGAVILLFQIGLESDVRTFRKVGVQSLWVAVVGVVAPFVIGTYVVGPWLLPGLSTNAYLFLGAALTATSVGITGRVFRDMGALGRPEAQIVLGAAVIDDVLGLIILSVVASIATKGAISPAEIVLTTGQALGFLAAAVVGGHLLAPTLSRAFAAIDRGPGTKFVVAISACLVFAYLAHMMGLAPIVGAFAAGLVLDEVKLSPFSWSGERDQQPSHSADAGHRPIESLVEPIGYLLVPVFFVLAGMQVKLELLFDPRILTLSAALAVAAVAGKLVAGLVAGRVDRWLVGWGMVPRGEVGLIFAFVGKSLGVVNDELFSVIVMMVVFTTLITPPVLGALLRRQGKLPKLPGRAVDQSA